MRFQDNLRNLRLSRKMTQMQLAESLGTSQSAITAWETGYRDPDFSSLKRIATFFGVPLSALISSDELTDEDQVAMVSDTVVKNYKLRLIVNGLVQLPEDDLDLVATIVAAFLKKNGVVDEQT